MSYTSPKLMDIWSKMEVINEMKLPLLLAVMLVPNSMDI